MSNKDLAKTMIDRLPDDKMIFIINILENLGEMSGVNFYPEHTPNSETRAAVKEVNEMIRTESGEHFSGSTEDFFAMLAEE